MQAKQGWEAKLKTLRILRAAHKEYDVQVKRDGGAWDMLLAIVGTYGRAIEETSLVMAFAAKVAKPATPAPEQQPKDSALVAAQETARHMLDKTVYDIEHPTLYTAAACRHIANRLYEIPQGLDEAITETLSRLKAVAEKGSVLFGLVDEILNKHVKSVAALEAETFSEYLREKPEALAVLKFLVEAPWPQWNSDLQKNLDLTRTEVTQRMSDIISDVRKIYPENAPLVKTVGTPEDNGKYSVQQHHPVRQLIETAAKTSGYGNPSP